MVPIDDGPLQQTWLTGKNAFCPNFHTEWSNSCLQDLANQTLLPLALPNYTANNFHCDWARWAKQATQARQLFTSFCPRGLRRTGTAFFRVSHVCVEDVQSRSSAHCRVESIVWSGSSFWFVSTIGEGGDTHRPECGARPD